VVEKYAACNRNVRVQTENSRSSACLQGLVVLKEAVFEGDFGILGVNGSPYMKTLVCVTEQQERNESNSKHTVIIVFEVGDPQTIKRYTFEVFQSKCATTRRKRVPGD
jgi:hypothetical protein